MVRHLLVVGHVGLFLSLARGQSVPVPPPVGSSPLPVVPAREPISFRDVVKKVLPAVVSLEAMAGGKKGTPTGKRPLPPGVPEEFRKFFEPEADVAPKPDANLGFGSGVIIDPAGVILTNFHVVEGADSVEVTLADGRKFTSTDISRDPKTDLALVKLTSDKPLPALALGDSDAMEVGDRVLAVGAPFGLTGSVTSGIVSAKSRQNLKLNQYEDFLQTDAAINPGNSGGPLVNLDGQVIGISAAIKSRTGGFQGVGLAVSSNLARDVAAQLLKDGVVRRGYLGVGVRSIDDDAGRLGVGAGAGVIVSRVVADSPAGKAGVKIGDVLVAIGGLGVKDVATFPKVVAKLSPGKPTELAVLRDGKPLTVTVTLEEQPGVPAATLPAPKPTAATLPLERAGLAVADLTPENAAQFGYPKATRGAVIVAVDRAGPAATVGLQRGQLVVKIDRTPITSAKDFAEALAAAAPDRGALLHVQRPSGEIDFLVLKVR